MIDYLKTLLCRFLAEYYKKMTLICSNALIKFAVKLLIKLLQSLCFAVIIIIYTHYYKRGIICVLLFESRDRLWIIGKNLHSAFEFKFKINTWIEFYSKYLPIILADDIWLTYQIINN